MKWRERERSWDVGCSPSEACSQPQREPCLSCLLRAPRLPADFPGCISHVYSVIMPVSVLVSQLQSPCHVKGELLAAGLCAELLSSVNRGRGANVKKIWLQMDIDYFKLLPSENSRFIWLWICRSSTASFILPFLYHTILQRRVIHGWSLSGYI